MVLFASQNWHAGFDTHNFSILFNANVLDSSLCLKVMNNLLNNSVAMPYQNLRNWAFYRTRRVTYIKRHSYILFLYVHQWHGLRSESPSCKQLQSLYTLYPNNSSIFDILMGVLWQYYPHKFICYKWDSQKARPCVRSRRYEPPTLWNSVIAAFELWVTTIQNGRKLRKGHGKRTKRSI